jgi:hypothetical protein
VLRLPAGTRDSALIQNVRRPPVPTQYPSHWIPLLFALGKSVGSHADDSHSSSAEVRNECSCISAHVIFLHSAHMNFMLTNNIPYISSFVKLEHIY